MGSERFTRNIFAGCAAKSCGSSADALAQLPVSLRDKVHNHPCYSEEAHHHYARMHVAVAPACNIQCHYCNRKYDCANESRPGVVSELLTPEQAVRKVLAVATHIPQMTVLGIAGPGDALANPQRTFATFRALREQAPDIKLCLSTNGLVLPDWVDALCEHQVEHVTITINCVDPDIGMRIYPWIFWQNRRIRGRRAAEILLAQQQQGLDMLVARGVLVKINSVLIPGVNDQHLDVVSQVVKAKGAFLHNIMPLISDPAHGTFFGLMGQREPTATELLAIQERCAGDMRIMRHCRQCRADAVGLLGEDRSAEFTQAHVDTMAIDYAAALPQRAAVQAAIETRRTLQVTNVAIPRIGRRKAAAPTLHLAVASRSGSLIDQHFGHATAFRIYAATTDGVHYVEERRVATYCHGNANCGESDTTLEQMIRALDGCAAVLCGRIGFDPWRALESAGIHPDTAHAMEAIEPAVAAVYQELLAAGIAAAPIPLQATA